MSWDTGTGGGAWDDGAATSGFNDGAQATSYDNFAAGGHADSTGGFGQGGIPPTAGYDGIATGDGDGEDAGGFGQSANDGACFNCGEQGHSKVDCPNPAKPRACFNCGEEGHNKAECPNPAVAREFTGTCRLCSQQGHRAADCPDAPPMVCNNCKEEGHSIVECKNRRLIDRSDIEDVPAEQAWAELQAASAERDLDDIMMATKKYIKANPQVTYVQLEEKFRSQNLSVYLIAIEKELAVTYTNMDLQGNLDKKYTVSWRLSGKHQRPKEKDVWPASPEENLARLTDAGEPTNRGIPKCGNCDQLGHTAKGCPEEKQENPDRAVVKCFNCEEVGHRVRDCPNPRPDKFACRNCKQSGHNSKECPEPRSAEGVECKKCGETGHFARDCPTGGGGGGNGCRNCGQEGHRAMECTEPRKLVCRNCDEEGHLSKECPKPRDYSRVQCSNCKQMGHTKVRCKDPIVDDEAGDVGNNNGYGGGGDPTPVSAPSGGDYGGGDIDPTYAGGDNWAQPTVAIGGQTWENTAAAPQITASGW